MKPDIHPKYYEAKVHCGSCGREWTVGSTREELRVDVSRGIYPRERTLFDMYFEARF